MFQIMKQLELINFAGGITTSQNIVTLLMHLESHMNFMYDSTRFDQAFVFGAHNGYHAIGGMQSTALLFSVRFVPMQSHVVKCLKCFRFSVFFLLYRNIITLFDKFLIYINFIVISSYLIVI